MRNKFLPRLALAFILASCASASRSELEPESGPLPDLSAMIVLRPAGGFERGDTVRVDLASVSADNRVTYYAGGRSGSVPFDVLGPSDGGTMVVVADTSLVRRCRSTGCSIVGYVTRGQEVVVSDFAGRWYRAAVDGKAVGYVRADHLQLPRAYRTNLLAEIEERTASYYDNRLKAISVDGSGAAFSGYDVRLDDGELSFEFYTSFSDGPGLAAVCDATRGIVAFVDRVMAGTSSELFAAYSVGVYAASPGAPVGDEDMVAGRAGDGGVYCAGS